MRATQFILSLIASDLWPVYVQEPTRAPMSVRFALEHLNIISKEPSLARSSACKESDLCAACGKDWGEHIRRRVDEWRLGLHGLCLACLKSEELSELAFLEKCPKHCEKFGRVLLDYQSILDD